MGAPGSHPLELAGLAGDVASPVHRLDPRAKLLGLLTVVLVAVSTPPGEWPVYAACGVTLAAIALAARVPAGEVWRRGRVVWSLVLAVALVVPLARTGGAAHELGPLTVHDAGLAVLGGVAAKATVGVVAAVLLAATTSLPAVLDGLRALRVPRVLVTIAGLMYRYLFVIADEAGRMRRALAARGYRPRTALRAGALGRVAGALFLRAHQRGERVYLAMLARGYGGEMPRLDPLAFGRADAAFAVAVPAALVPLRLLAGIGP